MSGLGPWFSPTCGQVREGSQGGVQSYLEGGVECRLGRVDDEVAQREAEAL